MNTNSTIDSRLLAEVCADAEYSDSEEWAAALRTAREVCGQNPGELESAVAIVVLADAALRHHMVERYEDWSMIDMEPFPELATDDDLGRGLIEELAHAAGHVLSLDPTNNLAVYLQAVAHEAGGAHEEAVAGYRRALELDWFDDDAEDRARALDEDFDRGEDEHGDLNPHSRHFWVLRIGVVTSNAGDEDVEYWRSSDPAAVREMVKWVLKALADVAVDGNATLDLTTYAPGEPEATVYLRDVVRRTPEGALEVDWTAVDLTEPSPGTRLPKGQPVRVHGHILFDEAPVNITL